MTDEQAWLDRALEHHKSGQSAEAETLYRRVLASNPEQPDALYLLGCLKQQIGDYEAAAGLLQKAVTVGPQQAEYWYALGLTRSSLEEPRAAETSYRRAIALAPEHAAALAALGRTIRLSNRKSREAAEYLGRAAALMPGHIDVACEWGDAWLEAGEPRQAANIYAQLLASHPELGRAWFSKGCAANALAEFVEARDCFRRALELVPEWLEARHNLARALQELGHVSEAYRHFRECAQTLQPGSEHALAMMAVIVPGVPEMDNAGILDVRTKWAKEHLPAAPKVSKRPGGRPRKVGYVSSFFQRDNWMKPVWGLINQHDRTAVQVYLFSDCAAARIQHGYRAHSEDRFFDTSGLSNGELAELIEEFEIDVLVDLNGYSNMRRLPLFAHKLALVTIGWFNMYATSGISGFDYVIGDAEVVPPEEEQFYSEKLLRVSGSYLTFDVNYPVPPIVSRLADENNFVYGALGSQYKITDEVIAAWCRILRAVPASVLLMKNSQIRSMAAAKDLVGRFARFGIGAHRLRFEGPQAHFEFLQAYDRIDLALDTFPYNGGTTTTEAIWQGVPVVTFYGDRWVSRTSASILRAGGLGEFVARDLDGYVELAVELARGGRERLSELRMGMRAKLAESAVCNTRRLAREMEFLFEACCEAASVAE